MKVKFLFVVLMIIVFSMGTIQAQEKTTKVEKVKIEKTMDKLCIKCGEVKGSEKCCNKEVVKCEKCELHKGSPGCCKMNKADKKVKTEKAECGSKKKCGGCGSKPQKK